MSRGRNSVHRLIASRMPQRVMPATTRNTCPRARIRATRWRFDPGMTGTDHFLLFGL
jgi:hypothetical protein